MLYSEERCFPRQVHDMRNKFALKCERACVILHLRDDIDRQVRQN